MKLAAFKMWLQLLPDQYGQILCSGYRTFGNKFDIEIEVAVIELVSDELFDQFAELFDIYHKAGNWIGTSFDGDEDFVIVPVPVLVGALSKYLPIALLTPSLYPQLMGRIESFPSSQIYHVINVLCRQKFKQRSFAGHFAKKYQAKLQRNWD